MISHRESWRKAEDDDEGGEGDEGADDGMSTVVGGGVRGVGRRAFGSTRVGRSRETTVSHHDGSRFVVESRPPSRLARPK